MSTTTRVLRNGRLLLPDRTLHGDLILEGGWIRALTPAGQGKGGQGTGGQGTGGQGTGGQGTGGQGTRDEIWDLEGRTVAPGLIDTHTHGTHGIDFYQDDAERIAEAAPIYARGGVTRVLVTLVPGPEEELLERIANAARACRLAPSALVGIHLEGPFLAADRKGALPDAGILAYDEGLMRRILDAGAGLIRVMTFAPESVPAEAVRRIQNTGLQLSIGHTSADADATAATLDLGVRRATHLCNAMPSLHHRAPGPVVPLLLDPRVRTEIIVDGEHLDDRFAALILSQKGPDGVLAVSDSMPLAGLGPQEGTFAGATVRTDGERATLADGTLAGSVTPLLPALRRFGHALDLSEQQLWSLGSRVPAQDLPLSNLGRLASGTPADLVILEPDGAVTATLRAGLRADEPGEGEQGDGGPGDGGLPTTVTRIQ